MNNCPKKGNFHAKRKSRSSGPRYELNLNCYKRRQIAVLVKLQLTVGLLCLSSAWLQEISTKVLLWNNFKTTD